MRFLWLTIVILIVVIAACALMFWSKTKPYREPQAWVANVKSIEHVPMFRALRRANRAGLIAGAVALIGALIAAAILAGGPVNRETKNPALGRRDMVLCLDASGSMLPYDGQILRTASELVDSFSGERMALEMWSARSIVKFPLTDDYQLMHEVLEDAARIIDAGYLGKEGDYVLVTPELSDYLQGVDSDEAGVASLIGDGLASCVLSFDHRDQERSRTIILATDNEVAGDQIYSLTQAVDFASDQGIEVIALYPALSGQLTSEGEQLRSVIEAAGGEFYKADDPAAISSIMERIESQQLAEADGKSYVVETDTPQTALSWTVWCSLIGLAVLVWRRI
ncbi:VWA domain-containing protein [Actinomycetaceae bacterium WB03_NA08]|uniref:VWA domain-containing protein n=1 Tax=Scrofimicrobium canadense TaxID=2652290 RepID=A0A6N7W813_9ACTO|nr:VWA domain-containing protein [Scrofimicrobium canadense]MSS84278.1 VWA domain-containing protein [Scrofimicrobium canadense]